MLTVAETTHTEEITLTKNQKKKDPIVIAKTTYLWDGYPNRKALAVYNGELCYRHNNIKHYKK
jgi:hypothetical protein